MIFFPIIASLISIAFAGFLIFLVKKYPTGSGKQIEIWEAIRTGSRAYLRRQNMTVTIVAIVLAAVIWLVFDATTAVGFLAGASASLLAGYLGMMAAVDTNVRTTEAAKVGLPKAFRVAFLGGSVTGFLVVGLGLLSVSVFYYFTQDASSLIGLAFGGSLVSVFARLGGGIYTKAADVGADLVGKVEAGIPEDDPRNPAVIADNVGDNVGDCAGMAAGLFASVILSAVILYFVLQGNIFYSSLVGLGISVLLFAVTEYYTSEKHAPVRYIAESSRSGPATTMIAGIAIGMQSVALPALIVGGGILVSYYLAGLYGVDVAVMAMLSLTGIVITMDAYGPITDNAGGIAEMSKLDKNIREVTDALDAVGNTTKAVTKAFAIGSAALAALTLFATYVSEVNSARAAAGITGTLSF